LNNGSKHKKNERIYSALSVCNIQTIVAQGAPFKPKEVQMAIVFHLLSFGRPMLEYEHMRGLLEQLGCPKLPIKHWSNTSGWEMAESLYSVVQNRTKVVVSGTKYLSLSCDEVITVDNQSWISIHAYVLVDWERVPLLLSLERLTEASNVVHITKVIVNAVVRDGGCTVQEIRERLVCFGSDGAEANFSRLADVKTMLSLAAILPLLQSVKSLVVFAQSPSVYVCDFTRALKLCY
jgi:hypothetical protein